MRKAEVSVGRTYVAKVSGKITKVKLVSESLHGGWDAVNVETGRRVRIRTAARLRKEVQANMRKKMRRNARKRSAPKLRFHAQPYDPSRRGFYFNDYDEYEEKYKKHLPTEEYELEFIDGPSEDADLFSALKVDQMSLEQFLDDVVTLSEHDKAALYYVATNGYGDDLDDMLKKVDDEVRVMEGDSKAYMEEYVDSMGGVSELGKKTIEMYFDYERFGRDLEQDLNADDENDQYLLDMDDEKRGETYVDDIGFESLGKTAEEYFDMDKFARDAELGGDISEFEFDGRTWTTDYHG